MKQYLTCIFKIHNPSAHKRAVMDHALSEYLVGYHELLDYAKDNLDHFQENGAYKDKFTAKSLSRLLHRPAMEVHSSVKDSLIQDVAANLASYFELVQIDEATSFPAVKRLEAGADETALDNFVLVGSDLDDYKESKRRYLRESKDATMPLFFCRSDGAAQTRSGGARNRNFSLLSSKSRDKLLAAMWLLPNGHKLCRPLGANGGNLVKIDSGEIFASNSKTAILVPLQLGRNGWQEHKFIDAALSPGCSVKTAHLVREADEYFLHTAFEFVCPKPYEPQSYLGVDRGVFFSMAYGLVDRRGGIMLMNANPDGYRDEVIQTGKRVQRKQKAGRRINVKDYRRKEREAVLHRLVNRIVEVAKEHQAMIVLEDLNIQIKGKFYKSAWAKVHKYFEYRCRLEGVPFWKGGIWAAHSSQICIFCGELNEGRKRDGGLFDCPSCGAVYHSDAGAAINIARRALYRKKDWKGHGGYRAFHRSFANGGRFNNRK